MRPTSVKGLLALNICLGFVPLMGMILYARLWLHDGVASASGPSAMALSLMAVVGVVLPLCGLAYLIRALVVDSSRFRILELLLAYLSLAVVFAGAFFLLQAATSGGAFGGMTPIWGEEPATFDQHLANMYAAFGEAAYLSVTTLTTVGYGDLAPVSALARLIAAIESLVGVGFVGLVLGHYFSFCTHHRQ